METILRDIRYAIRTMIKSPGFTAVAVLSLALGIGANTSIFSIVNTLLLKPLPYKDPDRLAQVFRQTDETGKGLEASELWSYPKFQVIRDNSETFDQLAAVSDQNFPVTDSDNPERLNAEMVSASYFPMLGVEASVGRTFSADEDTTPGTHPVALLSYGIWQRRFGGDAKVIGETISLNKVPLTIVGVLPEGFKGQKGTAEVWVPMMMAPRLTFPRRLLSPLAHWTEVIARLKPGVTPGQAQSEMGVVAAKLSEAIPTSGQTAPSPESIKLVSLKEAKLDPAIRKSFLVLFGAVGFVLLIACANIANLLLTRSVSRRKEIAIRLALGASRARLIRQLLTESVLLSTLGGVAGLLIAMWGVELLASFKPAGAERSNNYIQLLDFSKANVDGQVLAFNLLLSVVTGIVFGLLPALQASRPGVSDALKEGGLAAAPRSHSLGLSAKGILVVSEIALSLVLLIGAGLMIRSFSNLQALAIGFHPEQVMTFQVTLPKYKPEAEVAFDNQLLERINGLPGVQAATVASSTPLSSNSAATVMKVKEDEGEPKPVGLHSIGPDYFKTLRVPIIAGRSFTHQDREGARLVAIVNEAAAKKYWPNEDPIGKEIWLGAGWGKDQYGEIVGIVGDVKYGKVEELARPEVYLPYTQPTEPASFVLVRSSHDPRKVVGAVRNEILVLDKNVPVFDVKTMEERSASATSRTRFSALLLGVFALLALVLSAIGIYGVVSHAASGRKREIGIRMALGATSRDVLGLVVREGVVLTLAGIGLGLCGAFAVTRVLGSQLYGVGTTDAATFAVVSLLLGGLALMASYIPAVRAARIDPMVALRSE
ncbi:MAG TPA: ABC transporter permease [Blastocatellia bacterium]|nr:ABC transporter permease [Blastocatellia bacterium]